MATKKPTPPKCSKTNVDKLVYGYLARFITEHLHNAGAATVVELAAALPHEKQHRTVRGSIRYALAGSDFINPLFGVYGLSQFPPTWGQVARAANPLYAAVLDCLDDKVPRQTRDIKARIRDRDDEFSITSDRTLCNALEWLRSWGLAFKQGPEWAKSARVNQPCVAPTAADSLLDVTRAKMDAKRLADMLS